MKNKISIQLIVFFISVSAFSQTVFNKIYYDRNAGRANAVIQLSDNNFLVSGNSKNVSISVSIKTNSIGDTLWMSNLDIGAGLYGDAQNSSIEISNHNYIVCGTSGDPILHQSHATIIKYNDFGDTLWARKIGLPNRSERFYSVKQTIDGGFAFCGWRYDSTGASSDYYLVKTDSSGIPQWEHTYGGISYEFGLSLEVTAEKGYMIFGTTYSYGIGAYNMYLVKTDSAGNMIWQKTYGGTYNDYGESITKLNDGNYAIAGASYVSTDSTTSYVAKIDTAGNVIWEKKFRGGCKKAEFNSVKQLSTGEIIAAGDEQGDTLNKRYYGQLKKINETDGSIIWQKQYDYFYADSAQSYFYAMDICNDGGFVMAGMVWDLRVGANPTNSMWLVKTDCMGNDTTWDTLNCPLNVGITEISKQTNDLIISPNPSNGVFTISTDGQKIKQIIILNPLGQEIKTITNTETIDLTAYPKGIYFVEIKTDKGIINKKIILQ